jgi:glycosyltransferase involved in cell wall biosynthesis
VIVDDGSRDATGDRARAFAARDPRFRVVTTPHRGLVAALATGLAACRAAVVARMDADDVMHRDRLALQLAALDADPALAAVGSHVRVFPRRRLAPGLRAYERWLDAIETPADVRAEAFVECPVAHPTLAIRTDVLRTFGYRDVGWPEDYDLVLVLRLLARGHVLGVVPRRLLAWRDGPRRLWRTDRRYALDRFTACKAAHLAAGFLAGVDAYVLCGYGATGRALRKALLAHGKRPSRIVDVHPRRVGETIAGAPVVSVDELRRRPERPVVASVAGGRRRAEIRALLASNGLRELEDFVCAA